MHGSPLQAGQNNTRQAKLTTFPDSASVSEVRVPKLRVRLPPRACVHSPFPDLSRSQTFHAETQIVGDLGGPYVVP